MNPCTPVQLVEKELRGEERKGVDAHLKQPADYALPKHSEVPLLTMAKAKAAAPAPAMKKGMRRAMKARKAMK